MSGEVAFAVKPDALAVIQNLSIDANFAECEAALKEMIAPYAAMVVTEDNIAGAKADRAKIRKVATSIDEARKAVKKSYSEPLAVFESRCKALCAICDEGSNNLDKQVKAFEDAEAQSKIDAIRAVYDEGDDEVRDFCSWERVFNPKWTNKGFSFDDAKEAVLLEFKKTREDLATIRTMDEQDVPALILEYKRSHDLAAVVRMSASLKQAHEEQAKRKAEDAARALAVESHPDEPSGNDMLAQAVENMTAQAKEVPTKIVDFRVWATDRQLQSLKGFLRANGIKYGRVE